jgi:hypothetical protein
VKFIREFHRNAVLQGRKLLREKRIPVFINEDLPPETVKRRYQLRMECNKASQAGKRTRLLGDKLIIDDVTYIIDEEGRFVQQQGKQRQPASTYTPSSSQ